MEPGIIQQNGYVWLSCPREGIMPLNLLESEENNLLKRVFINVFDISANANVINADVFALFPKSKRGLYPVVNEKPKNVSFFEGHDILDVSAGINIETLKELSFIGSAKAKANLKVADKLLFSFKNVLLFTVENEILLEEHLNIVKPNANAPGFLDKLKKGRIYVVTEVLQTNEFKVRNASEFQYTGKIEASAIKKYIDANAELNSRADSNEIITYKGETPITFSLKAAKIQFDEKSNNYTLIKKQLKNVRRKEVIEGESLFSDNGLVIIE